ncbi:hypothetical protein AYL99_11013 [Fonsecaea erecta]|uniref:Ribonucleotide reductase large subunit C-terminal domain-containing protein n=1 Tax=Fonsecaea erecta TaxID=1367422 RepID=A0A178Z682_9EURO|nr:hypothetical protein AYL99_11013 [Fonsecaea erecta]OAP54565.1 hypothetical protein AYL99_11013 [Fonsecaea erecta]
MSTSRQVPEIPKYGIRNSLLVALMPTASTSQLVGEDASSCISRRVLTEEFQVVNPSLLEDLVDLGLWSDNTKNRIITEGGSIQTISTSGAGIPNTNKQTT